MLHITLSRTGDNQQDYDRLAQLRDMLRAESGEDSFVVLLEGGGRDRLEFAFPNDHTRYSPHLRELVATFVGADALRVITAM